ncbi:MAG: hypothetical protein ACE5G0_12000 [Rhodothermales bacterium]
MRRYSFLLLCCLFFAACTDGTEPASHDDVAIETPTALIEAMRERYRDDWYHTLTFVQETVRYRQDGSVDTATWYEAYAAPGKLRIDFAPLEDGNGMLFAGDSQYVFRDGEMINRQATVHPLLLLGFDVYHLPAEETVRKLDTLGFDLTKMHETMWQNRPTYVVGAEEGEEKAPQFWIDKEHLYFTRMLRPAGPDSSISEVQFNNYERQPAGWIAPEVVFHFDQNRVMLETYNEIRTGVDLDTTLFDPARWRTTHWHQ